MKHVIALFIKFVAVGTVLFSLLAAFENASIAGIFLVTVITTVVAYVIGDMFALPKLTNAKALLADFGLAFVIVWASSYLFIGPARYLTLAVFFASLGITAAEVLFHMYMRRFVFDQKEETLSRNMNYRYATEIAEEQNDFKTERKQTNE